MRSYLWQMLMSATHQQMIFRTFFPKNWVYKYLLEFRFLYATKLSFKPYLLMWFYLKVYASDLYIWLGCVLEQLTRGALNISAEVKTIAPKPYRTLNRARK